VNEGLENVRIRTMQRLRTDSKSEQKRGIRDYRSNEEENDFRLRSTEISTKFPKRHDVQNS